MGINVTKEPLCCTLCPHRRRRATAMGKRGNEEKREEKKTFFSRSLNEEKRRSRKRKDNNHGSRERKAPAAICCSFCCPFPPPFGLLSRLEEKGQGKSKHLFSSSSSSSVFGDCSKSPVRIRQVKQGPDVIGGGGRGLGKLFFSSARLKGTHRRVATGQLKKNFAGQSSTKNKALLSIFPAFKERQFLGKRAADHFPSSPF